MVQNTRIKALLVSAILGIALAWVAILVRSREAESTRAHRQPPPDHGLETTTAPSVPPDDPEPSSGPTTRAMERGETPPTKPSVPIDDLLATLEHLARDYDKENVLGNRRGWPATYAQVTRNTWERMLHVARAVSSSGRLEQLVSILGDGEIASSVRGIAADLLRLAEYPGWRNAIHGAVQRQKTRPDTRTRLLTALVCSAPFFPSANTPMGAVALPNWEDAEDRELGSRIPDLLLPRKRAWGEPPTARQSWIGLRYPDGTASPETVQLLLEILDDSDSPEMLRLVALDALQWSVNREAGREDPILNAIARIRDAGRCPPELEVRLEAQFRTWGDEMARTGESLSPHEWTFRLLTDRDPVVRQNLLDEFNNRGGIHSISESNAQLQYARAFLDALATESDLALRCDIALAILTLPAEVKEKVDALPRILELIQRPLDEETRADLAKRHCDDDDPEGVFRLAREVYHSRYTVARSLQSAERPQGRLPEATPYPAGWTNVLVTGLIQSLPNELDPLVRAAIYRAVADSGEAQHASMLQDLRSLESEKAALAELNEAIHALELRSGHGR